MILSNNEGRGLMKEIEPISCQSNYLFFLCLLTARSLLKPTNSSLSSSKQDAVVQSCLSCFVCCSGLWHPSRPIFRWTTHEHGSSPLLSLSSSSTSQHGSTVGRLQNRTLRVSIQETELTSLLLILINKYILHQMSRIRSHQSSNGKSNDSTE